MGWGSEANPSTLISSLLNQSGEPASLSVISEKKKCCTVCTCFLEIAVKPCIYQIVVGNMPDSLTIASMLLPRCGNCMDNIG